MYLKHLHLIYTDIYLKSTTIIGNYEPHDCIQTGNQFFSEEETEVKESLNEDKKEDSGFNIAGVDEEVDRIVNLANYQ